MATVTLDPGPLYKRAASKARTAEDHGGVPGTHGLGSIYQYRGSEDCPGRLRTAYVRERAADPTYRGRLGPPKWVPIGIVCTACYVVWAAPAGEAAPE